MVQRRTTDYEQFGILPRLRDNIGRLEVSEVQNLFEADFEYSAQPMRWEQYIVGGALITPQSNLGGVILSVTGAAGDCAIRQTRPYIRYQPGKTTYMASGMLFGQAYTNQRQRLGFFDDANGVFFEQGDPTATNPTGMAVVYRTDAGGKWCNRHAYYFGSVVRSPRSVWQFVGASVSVSRAF